MHAPAPLAGPPSGWRGREAGITLFEPVTVEAIPALVSAIAAPADSPYIDDAPADAAIAGLTRIEARIERYAIENGELPDALANLRSDAPLGRRGNSYRYQRIAGVDASGHGSLRTDRNLVPFNSDYDLVSASEDGLTNGRRTAKANRDDILRANNGGLLGGAEEYRVPARGLTACGGRQLPVALLACAIETRPTAG
jgi:general secretion pathway protein G